MNGPSSLNRVRLDILLFPSKRRVSQFVISRPHLPSAAPLFPISSVFNNLWCCQPFYVVSICLTQALLPCGVNSAPTSRHVTLLYLDRGSALAVSVISLLGSPDSPPFIFSAEPVIPVSLLESFHCSQAQKLINPLDFCGQVVGSQECLIYPASQDFQYFPNSYY